MKKIISTGLAMLMLVSVAGTTQCFAVGQRGGLRYTRPQNGKMSQRKLGIGTNSRKQSKYKEPSEKQETLIEISTRKNNGTRKKIIDKHNKHLAKKNAENRHQAEINAKIDCCTENLGKVVAVASLAGAVGYIYCQCQNDI